MAKKVVREGEVEVETGLPVMDLNDPLGSMRETMKGLADAPLAVGAVPGLKCPRDGTRRFEWRKKCWLDAGGQATKVEDVYYCDQCHGEFYIGDLVAV